MVGSECQRGDERREPRSVLVVDDEPSIREFLAFVLSDEGYRVITAADGREALERLAGDAADVVLTDLMMPGMDGWELIAQLRQARHHVRAIIAMSALAAAGARSPDADLFIQKPFEIEQVLTSVNSLLSAPPCPTRYRHRPSS